MPSVDTADALDLAPLVERLRLAGFRVDTRQYLTAHELLLAYAAAGIRLGEDVDRLTACLGPIFCTSPDEQETFAREVAAWRGKVPVAPALRLPTTRDGQQRKPFQLWRRARWWRLLLFGSVPILIVLGLLYVRYYVPLDVTGRVKVQLADGRVVAPSEAPGIVEFSVNGQPTSLTPDGMFAVSATRRRAVLVEARLDGYQATTQEVIGGLPASPILTLIPAARRNVPVGAVPTDAVPDPIGVALSGESTDERIRWGLVLLGALATSLVALAVFWLVDGLKYRLALRQLPIHGDPESVTLSVPETPVLPTTEQDLKRMAVALRRPREGMVLDLDIAGTVDVTVRSAGFFEPRFSARRAMPEYVVLVSRRGAADHQARTFDAVLTHLAGQDVALDTYSFVDDPRTCSADRSGESYLLREVLERHHRATLIVAGETISAFNRATGRLASWVEIAQAHAGRIFLTTEAPDRWSEREERLERAGFVVLPATEAGWRALASVEGRSPAEQLFPAPYTRAYPALLGADELRWLDRNEPPAEITDKLIRALKGFLGPDGFAWLCACAIYPEISWPLTLRLRGTASATAVLPSMARLPWFRHGFMPDWLRRTLVAQVPAADERRLRTDLERLLEDLARERRRADGTSALHIGRWIGPIDLMRAAASGSPLRDRVFLGFMTGARDSLWLEAPRALRRLFERRPASLPIELAPPSGVAPLARRTAARLRYWMALNPAAARSAGALAIGVIALFPLAGLLAIERVSGIPEAIWFAEIPEGPFALGGSGDNVVNLRAFFISRTEVTVAQYQVCVDAGVCRRAVDFGGFDVGGEPDWPIHTVTWEQALQYCAWLESKLRRVDGAGPVFEALRGVRDRFRWQVTLPSEAEWEKAATGRVPRKYPWGGTFDSIGAHYRSDPELLIRTPVAVGSYPLGISPFGLADMAGNVSEWTRTIYSGKYGAPYRIDDGRESLDTTTLDLRVIRGGSFNSDPFALEVTSRAGAPPHSHTDALGFRVAIVPISAPPLVAQLPPRSAESKAPPVPEAPKASSSEPTAFGVATVGLRTYRVTRSHFPIKVVVAAKNLPSCRTVVGAVRILIAGTPGGTIPVKPVDDAATLTTSYSIPLPTALESADLSQTIDAWFDASASVDSRYEIAITFANGDVVTTTIRKPTLNPGAANLTFRLR